LLFGNPKTREENNHFQLSKNMSETPPPKTNEEIVGPLLSHLGASLSELWLLPPAFLEESVSDLRLAPPAAARLLIALARLRPPPPQEKSLERYLSDREARDDEPWRREARKAEVQLESFSRGFAEEGAMEGLRRDFLSGAKAGLFSEEEALCLSYLLCSASSPARAVYDLSCLLLLNTYPLGFGFFSNNRYTTVLHEILLL
jgi:hypothetical protein